MRLFSIIVEEPIIQPSKLMSDDEATGPTIPTFTARSQSTPTNKSTSSTLLYKCLIFSNTWKSRNKLSFF
jgi:hypothetical protein